MTQSHSGDAARCAVIGDPVAHSKSPLIHGYFAEQTGLNLDYQAIRVQAGNTAEFVERFFQEGGRGLNVTVPLKEEVFSLCEVSSPRAELAAAVNTLYMRDQQLCGENTDGPGLIRDIQINNGFALDQARILILGAGGAIRGVLAALAEIRTGEIVLVNRTRERAEQLQQDFAANLEFSVSDFDNFQASPFDLVINGTSASLDGEIPAISAAAVNSDSFCYDLMYADGDTAFISWARDAGAGLTMDGLGMLVEQAADSFAIWHGLRPQTEPVITQLRDSQAA